MIFGLLRLLFGGLMFLVALAANIWAIGALVFDLPLPMLRGPLAIIYTLVLLAVIVYVPRLRTKVVTMLCGFLLVLSWWRGLAPSNDRPWQPDVEQLAWAEVDGDLVTLHNVRKVEYRTETDYTPHWETRQVDLSKLTGMDLFINYWGSPWMAHPIVSFQFADAPPLCFSIETRKEVDESYSALGGLYRQFELVYVVADERDVVRLRTNFRQDEEVYLYRTRATPAQARERFEEYLTSLMALRQNPRWYNALSDNCTTSIRLQRPANKRAAMDWRLILNGKADQLLYDNNFFSDGGLPFAELKAKALVNPAAKAANDSPEFSALIREGRPGFQVVPVAE